MQGDIGINGGAADALVNTDALALLIGMLLDQQVPMEWAFAGPLALRDRLGGRLDVGDIVERGPEAITELFARKPALHRYPKAMAGRTYALCAHLLAHYSGDAGRVWASDDAAIVLKRLRELPGFGEEKAKILLAILGKRHKLNLRDWRALAAPFSDDQPRSVADIDGPAALERVRAWKKAQKARGLGKQD